jgi:hypothetical protein
VTDDHALRGPDFLPYDLPAAPQTSTLVAPPPAPPTKGRWERALEGVPNLGVFAIGAGAAALILLVLITWLADKPGPGATVVTIAAFASLIAGKLALKPEVGKDSRTLIAAGQTVGVVSAITAVLVYAAATSDDTQPIAIPSPQPTVTTQPSTPVPTQPQVAPTQPALPTPGPSVSTPPGAVNGFGIPSQPGSPLTLSPTDEGTLYGHVVDTAGKPIAGATVTITRGTAGDVSEVPDCPTRITTQTDAQGVYRQQLCQLADGLGYTVTITVGGVSARSNLFVNSGQTTVYDVILPVRKS